MIERPILEGEDDGFGDVERATAVDANLGVEPACGVALGFRHNRDRAQQDDRDAEALQRHGDE